MKSSEIFKHFAECFGIEHIDFKKQGSLLKRLKQKYSDEEIIYALDYYKKQGVSLYSLGYLLYGNNMIMPCTEYHAKEVVAKQDGTAESRNMQRIRQNSQAYYRKESYLDLFKES